VHNRNAKCDGLLIVRRLGAFHPEVLAPQFHVMVLNVLEEVYCVCMHVSSICEYADLCIPSLITLHIPY